MGGLKKEESDSGDEETTVKEGSSSSSSDSESDASSDGSSDNSHSDQSQKSNSFQANSVSPKIRQASARDDSDGSNIISPEMGEQNSPSEEENESSNEENFDVKKGNQIEEKSSDSESEQGADQRSSEDEEAENTNENQSDSGDEAKQVQAKRKHAVLSDDSGAENENKKIKPSEDSEEEGESTKIAEELFGDAEDISSDEEKSKENKTLNEEVDDEVDESAAAVVDDEDEELPPETRIVVKIPKINISLGKEVHFVKLPNFLSVDPRPFDSNSYEDEIDEEETLDEEGRARLKLKVGNTIRWRSTFGDDGHVKKESNARLVRWSDGSMSLHLGSEIFDVYKQPLQGDHNHLFIRQGTGLQGEIVFRTKLSFRPHSTESFTHRKMTLSLADRSQKTQKVKVLTQVGKDPETHRSEMMKKEEVRLKASTRRENKQRRVREKVVGGSRLNASYLEPDRDGEDSEDESAISLAAIKNKYKKGNMKDSRPPIYSSDDDGSDFESHPKKPDKIRALKDSDEEEEDSESQDSEDEGEDKGEEDDDDDEAE